MIYRNLKENERDDVRKLQSIVYFSKFDKDYVTPDNEFDLNRWKYDRGAFTDDGKLAALLEMIPFSSYLDGTAVGSTGISGVATLLEHRRGGAVKNLLKNAYKEMYEKGDVMSYLYPFSHEYYMKYGYAQGSYAETIITDLKNLKKSRCTGYTRQYFPEDGFDDLKYIYNRFAPNYNCCIAREDWRWKRLFTDDPYTSDKKVFIRYSSEGEPLAYIQMKPKHIAEYTYDLQILKAAWHGDGGIQALMAIFDGFKGDLRKLIFDTPPGFPAELIVKEHWMLEVTRNHTGMNRIINVPRALEIMKKPAGTGAAVISVQDESAPWNTGNWLVEWSERGSAVTKTEALPDISCDITSLSQLITGYYPLEHVINNDDVRIHGNRKTLDALFVKKPCYIWDRF